MPSRFAENNNQIKTIQVPVIDFKESLEKYGMPYFMKVDIEGMGMNCLNTLLQFQNKPTYLSIEA